ncbi:MAG: erythromycin biosynthesis sensory transduction protein EryC1 [Actinomycetes bacterium]|nr:MAG: erythromycin biosynthesis sensory transduction protein EryC1 [Actinomycetes bacterium]
MDDRVVPFVDLGRTHDAINGDILDAIEAVVDSGDFILGSAVERFERAFASFVGVGHGTGVGSGTAALTVATLATGIEAGQEVIVPAHTYIATALGVMHAGAVPVFCEVDSVTGLIDLDSAAAAVGGRTAAVVPVHLYGQACPMDEVAAFAERHGLVVIEDAAQAHGASWRGAKAGSFGHAAAFSFYPSKNLGALGDGGIVLTDDEEVAAAARRWRNLGQRAKGEHVEAGFNTRLDTLQAAALSIKLRYLDGWNASRREASTIYRERLGGVVGVLPRRPGADDVWHLFPVLVADRDRVAERMRGRGIGVGLHYTPAVHMQPPFGGQDRAGEFPVAEAWAARELSLPMFPGITRSEVERAADALLESVGDAGR